MRLERLNTPSRNGETPRKRHKPAETIEECQVIEPLSNGGSPEEVPAASASHVFTRTSTQKYTAIACLDDYITFNLKSVYNWSDPHKSQKHIRSIVTRIATFDLSLALPEEVEILESECPAPGTSEWQSWHRKRRECYVELEKRVEAKIKSEEANLGVTKVPKEFSNSVSALDKRLGNIKWQIQGPQLYNDNDALKFRNYFMK